MVDTLLARLPMADMLALDTLVLLPPSVLDFQPPLMSLDNSTQLPNPTSMMLPEMLAVMLPLPLRSMCTICLARHIQLLSPTLSPLPLLPPQLSELSDTEVDTEPLLVEPLPLPQPLPPPLLSELLVTELDTEPSLVEPLPLPQLPLPRLLPPQP